VKRRLVAPLAALLLALPAGADESDLATALAAMQAGNFAEAYCLWKPLAEQGNAEAQYHLGWLYANGNGLRVNAERAVAWWRQAAEDGHADAQFAMGLAATVGDGMERDLPEAVGWYALAAEQGHEDARDMLLRLAADPAVNIPDTRPDLLAQPWFGWTAELSGERVNVRAGPGIKHSVVGQLGKGERVRVVARRGDWLRVAAPPALGAGAAVWIRADLVREAPP
jgi:uncharacterized protein YgiM (DUF1202 family)